MRVRFIGTDGETVTEVQAEPGDSLLRQHLPTQHNPVAGRRNDVCLGANRRHGFDPSGVPNDCVLDNTSGRCQVNH